MTTMQKGCSAVASWQDYRPQHGLVRILAMQRYV